MKGAKQFGGVWLPETEVHFVDWMKNSKRAAEVDGKLTYQHHKLSTAMQLQPEARRNTCVDIGAHAALWSMWLVDEFEELIAFEPVALHADCFDANMVGKDYTLHRIALGSAPGTVSIEVPPDMTGNAHIAVSGAARHPGGKHSVLEDWPIIDDIEMRTLDSFDLWNVDFIKIDVEGYELSVVAGARETILRCRPLMVVEQKGNESAYGDNLNAALTYLTQLGMRVQTVMAGDYFMGWK